MKLRGVMSTDAELVARGHPTEAETHGRGGLGRAAFGSVADDVLRRARCPVLLLRVTEESRP